MSGWINDKLGRKFTLIVSAILFLVSAIGSAIPQSLTEFIIYRIIGGLGVGAASMTSPLYISEISPTHLRGRMVSLNQLAIILGMLIVYFINYWISGQGDANWNISTGWRWMFASEAIPALLLLILLYTVPESPRWLCQKNRIKEAESILKKTHGKDGAALEIKNILQSINSNSSKLSNKLNSKIIKRIAVIGISLAALQQITGINVFLYYAPEIFKTIAGANTDIALMQTIIIGAVNLIFTIVAIMLVDKVGRKPLMLIGTIGMGISLASIGFASTFGIVGSWLLPFILGYIASFAMSVGPVTWVLLSELFPNALRGRLMAVATIGMWLANFIVSQTFPMMDEQPWLVETFNHGFPFFLYAFFCLVLFGLILILPETKGKSLEEIEEYWKK